MPASPTIVAITPEHYNRMYRILTRGIPVKIEIEVRNRVGDNVEQAMNLVGEIPGSDLEDEVVMIGAHLDTWHARTSGTRRDAPSSGISRRGTTGGDGTRPWGTSVRRSTKRSYRRPRSSFHLRVH